MIDATSSYGACRSGPLGRPAQDSNMMKKEGLDGDIAVAGYANPCPGGNHT